MTQRIKVLNTETGETLSLKKFNEASLIEFNKKHLAFAEIVARKLLSRAKLERLVAAGALKECKFKNKKYIERTELFNFFHKK